DTSFLADGAGPPREWPPAPGELVSLWDMLRFHADVFVSLVKVLDRVMNSVGSYHARMIEANPKLARDADLQKAACEGLWEGLEPLLNDVVKACAKLELKDPVSLVTRIRARCQDKLFDVFELQGTLRSLGDLIETQLGDRVLMFVPAERA